jgi:hypothetical protein
MNERNAIHEGKIQDMHLLAPHATTRTEEITTRFSLRVMLSTDSSDAFCGNSRQGTAYH